MRLDTLLKQDRRLTIAGLSLVIVFALGYLVALGPDLDLDLSSLAARSRASGQPEWTLAHVLVTFAMWWIMMIAMMLPSAAQVVLLAAAINRKAQVDRPPFGPTGMFALGYVLMWGLFSVLAVAAQWGLSLAGALSEMTHLFDQRAAGVLLAAAGLWQLSPMKSACLTQCRSPMHFLTRRRRPGAWGALLMGSEHGAYCVGCCWLLMALLFAGGVMNLYWIVGLAAYVLAEKLVPNGERFARITGGLLVVAGVLWMSGAWR
jgi:predicted metal-binding membrane protein